MEGKGRQVQPHSRNPKEDPMKTLARNKGGGPTYYKGRNSRGQTGFRSSFSLSPLYKSTEKQLLEQYQEIFLNHSPTVKVQPPFGTGFGIRTRGAHPSVSIAAPRNHLSVINSLPQEMQVNHSKSSPPKHVALSYWLGGDVRVACHVKD